MTAKISVFLALLVAVSPAFARKRPPPARAAIRLFPIQQVRLELLYHPDGITLAQAKAQHPSDVALTSGFFNCRSLFLAGLFKNGVYQHQPSDRPNRPAVGQLKDKYGGEIRFLTTATMKAEIQRYRVAAEAGPFLIHRGRRWELFDIADSNFYRPTWRMAIGRTASHLITAEGFGQLRAFRSQVRHAVRKRTKEPILELMNLDGGSSVHGKSPGRLVVAAQPSA